MSDKLTTTSFATLILRDDHLMILEPSFLHDRVRRVQFNHVEHLTVWRDVAVWRLVISLLIALPGVLLMTLGHGTAVLILGAVLLGLSLLVAARYVFRRRVGIRLVRGRTVCRYHVIASEQRVERFVEQLTRRIDQTQQRIRDELASAVAEKSSALNLSQP